MNSIDNILGNVSATQNHVAQIENKLFEVVKIPLTPRVDETLFQKFINKLLPNPKFFKAPLDVFGVYNTTNGNHLGTMGKDFTAMQPKEFLDNIIETIHEFDANLDLNTLEFNQYRGGSKIEFSIKMHPISFKNNKGINDITNLSITFSTSYDGSKSNVISLYTERLVCLNGMVANKLQGTLKGRNTKGGKAKILSYAKELAEIINGAENFKEKMIALDKITISKPQIQEFKKSLLGYNEESLLALEGNHTKKFNILSEIDECIALEFGRTGETAFGLLQGITYYTNHIANNSKTITDQEYIRFNQGFKTNAKAQELLFALVD